VSEAEKATLAEISSALGLRAGLVRSAGRGSGDGVRR
jgi:hypothetical protein